MVNLDITEFVERMKEVNRLASDYEYEDLYDNPDEDAVLEIIRLIDSKLSQWEYELRYNLQLRGKKQDGEDLDKELERKKAVEGTEFTP